MRNLCKGQKISQAHIAVFLLTFCSMDTLLFGTNGNDRWQFYLVCALLAYEGIMLLHYYYSEKRNLRFRSATILVSVAFILLLVLTQIMALLNGSYAMEIQYFYHILLLVVVVTVVHLVSRSQFTDAFIDVMRVYGIAAIILFLLEKTGIAYHLPSYKMINTSGYLYYHFGLGVVAAPREYVAVRAYGIFREPGVFAIYMCVALYFELFFRKNPRFLYVVTLGIAAILSYSTAGYIALGMYTALYVLLKPSRSNKELLGKVSVVIACSLLIVFGFSEEMQKEVFGKLFVENDSLNSRVYSIIGGFTYSLQSPLWGHGWKQVINEFANYMSSAYGLTNISFTNTYIRMACTYGWLFSLLALYGVWRFHNRVTKAKGLAVLLFLCWIIIFSNENFLLNPLIYIVGYYGCDSLEDNLVSGVR